MSLAVRNVSFAYPPGRAGTPSFALRDVDLDIATASITGLLGPNGCGKTTLLKLLSGVLQPTSGRVELDGRRLSTMPRRETARHLAVVPQETHPAFDYSALEIVLMGRHPHLRPMQVEGPADIAIAFEAMEATSTAHVAGRPFYSLSGGEKQRVVIASALAQQPQVLLLDEPTASLDLGHQLEVASLLTGLSRRRAVTMVLATHDLNLAASLCDTLVLVSAGAVLAHGRTREVLTDGAIRALYGIEADVRYHEAAGHLTVVPVGRARS
jgi:iron complex transport system ATP-binding protein